MALADLVTTVSDEPDGSSDPALISTATALSVRFAGRFALCLAATFIAFVLASLTFDPIAQLQAHHPRPPQAAIDATAARLGMDHAVPQRFLWWLSRAVTGDLGTTVSGRPVREELGTRAATSFWLYLPATVLAIVCGCMLGLRSARRRKGEAMNLLVTVIVLALPAYVLGTLLKVLWLPVNEAAGMQLLYFTGERSPGAPDGPAGLVDRLQHLVLPTLCIAIPQIVYYARYQRAAALDVTHSSYVRAARARGLPPGQAFRRHGLRTALVPMTSLFAFGFGIHLAAGVFTEKVFGWHGLGSWLIDGIAAHDALVCTSIIAVLAVLVVVAGWIADIVCFALDPRTRGEAFRVQP